MIVTSWCTDHNKIDIQEAFDILENMQPVEKICWKCQIKLAFKDLKKEISKLRRFHIRRIKRYVQRISCLRMVWSGI